MSKLESIIRLAWHRGLHDDLEFDHKLTWSDETIHQHTRHPTAECTGSYPAPKPQGLPGIDIRIASNLANIGMSLTHMRSMYKIVVTRNP